MAAEWATTRIGKVANLNPDVIGSDWRHSHIRYIDISSVEEGQLRTPPEEMGLSEAPSRARRLVQKGDTVLSTVRPNRRSMFFASEPGDDWVVSTGFAVLRPDPSRIAPRYLYACVFNRQFTEYLISREKGAAYPAVSPEDIATAEIPLPPINEQRAIACILGAFDDKIELNRRMNETLEAIAQVIFKSWFVDFDPVRAKALGQEPIRLGPNIAELFPDSFADSELGEIPAGWTIEAVGDLIQRFPVGRKYEQKTVKPSGTVPVLDQGKSGVIGYHNDEPGVTASPENPIAVFANHTCYMRLVYFPFSSIQNVLPFIGKEVDTIWIFFATYGIQPFIEYKGHWPDFIIHRLVVPDTKLTTHFSKQIHPLLKRIWANEVQSQTLSLLRDALLPKLISGELRVKDAERIVARCA